MLYTKHKQTSTGDNTRLSRRELLLLAALLLFYLLTRLVGIEHFPISFFGDEALQVIAAEELLDHQLHDTTGNLLPPYFRNADKWNLSLSVYLQALSLALFGKSVLVARATVALVSLLGALAVALTLRQVFGARLWWGGALVMTVLPTWLLHSRTAFETVLMVAFYASFLYCYLRYRYGAPWWLLGALVAGAATCYSYTNGQGVMLVSGVLLLLADLPYHWQQLRQRPRLLVLAVLTGLVLAMPYLRFRFLMYPNALTEQLAAIDSYWLKSLPLSEKLARFASNYAQGLDPRYWFLPNEVDIIRHRWKASGHLPLVLLPLWLIGLVGCLARLRSAAHRTILIALLAAPFSAALVGILVTRVLAMVVPAALLICLGMETVVTWLGRWLRPGVLAIGWGLALSLGGLALLNDGLGNGPTWYPNYGLYGMQYGAAQLFGTAVPAELAADPQTQLIVSSTWANNTDLFAPFFLDSTQRSRLTFGTIDPYLIQQRELLPNTVFVMTPPEYDKAKSNPILALAPPQRLVLQPDQQPAFYFVRVQYAPNAAELFEAARQARFELTEETLMINGASVRVGYTTIDIGQIKDIFDGNVANLARGKEANPFIIELTFAEPQAIGQISLDSARMDFVLTLRATPADGGKPKVYTSPEYRGLPGEPHIDYQLPGGPQRISKLRIEIKQLNAPEVTHIHVRELRLRP